MKRVVYLFALALFIISSCTKEQSETIQEKESSIIFLLFVVFGHILATRGISYWYGPFAEFEGVSFSLWWVPGYFYPYYFLLFMAGLYHGTMGAANVLQRVFPGRRSKSKLQPYIVPSLGAIGVVLALLSFGGFLFEIEDPRNNDYARQYGELMDIDLTKSRE